METVFTVCTVELLYRDSTYSCLKYSVTLTTRTEIFLKSLLTQCSTSCMAASPRKLLKSNDCVNTVCSLTVISGE